MEYYHSLISLEKANMDFKLRQPVDFSLMMLKILEQIVTWGRSEEPDSVGMPYLYIDPENLKRAFIVKSGQIVSFAFPFRIGKKRGSEDIIVHHRSALLDAALISKATTIANDNKRLKSYAAVATGLDLNDSLDASAASLFEEIMALEPSYIRYDYDKKSARGQLHPTYHFDVNYSMPYTYKLGLYRPLSINKLIAILDKNTKCSYVDKYYVRWYCTFKRRVKKLIKRRR